MNQSLLINIHKFLKEKFPTSPHYLFEAKKNYYGQIKKQVDNIYDAYLDMYQSLKDIDNSTRPMGMNHHFYTYLAAKYGKVFKTLRTFEKVLKSTIPELKDFYKDHNLPDSKEVYTLMKQDFELLLPLANKELEKAKIRSPQWNEWESNFVNWDEVNQIFKQASK